MSKVLFIHVSDVHFGSEFHASRATGRGSSAPPPGGMHVSLPGLSAHDVGACEELENEVLALKGHLQPDRIILLVTGDLTVMGRPSEFVMANTFLQGRIKETWRKSSGLGLLIDNVVSVPGNHDHLRGNYVRTAVRARPSANVYPYFRGTRSSYPDSWWQHEVVDEGDVRIEIGALDSCGAKSGQIFARGSIDVRALDELRAAITSYPAPPPGTHVVRILLLHHGMDHPSGRTFLGQTTHQVHKLDAPSESALGVFCAQTKTQFVLTGHLHAPRVPDPSKSNSVGMEIRCGSSLQAGRQSKHGQIFMAHLVEGGPSSRWTTRVFQRKPGTRGFVEAPTWFFQFAI